MSGYLWTPEKDAIIRQAAVKGHPTQGALGHQFGVTKSTIQHRVKALGLVWPPQRNGYRTFWTDELEQELRQWRAAGLSFSRLAEQWGVSKNTLIGKANRMGLLNQIEIARETTTSRLDELNRFPPTTACCFPSGHPGEPGFAFCGDPVARVGVPYCRYHIRRAYLPGKQAN